ncbi:MAG: cation diffusion facilitator family transporter [Bryobacteraceae bacterium]
MHAHSHDHGGTGRILKWSFFATVAFVGIEGAAGVQAGSLALLSDAGHNLTDALALLFAWYASRLESKPANEVKTFGYHRMGVLAAFLNALVLLLLSLWIFYESYERLLRPETVQENTMLIVAALGLLLNGAIMWSLRLARQHDINVRSAYVHMLGDALGSIGIVIGAIVIHYTGWQRIDAVLSLIIGALIVWTAWDIVHESLNILLEGLPRGIALQSVTGALQSVEGVIDVHDLHIWSLGSSTHALSCHALIEDVPPSTSDGILRRMNHVLADKFGIRHTTVQFEHVGCAVSESGCCVIPVSSHTHQHQH